MRRVLAPGALALVGAFLFVPFPTSAQLPGHGVEFTLPGSILNLRLPNGAGKSILTPTGWGAAYNTVFGGAGYQTNTPSTGGADADWGFGVGLGDPVLLVGVQITGTVYDFWGFSHFGLGAKVHRYLGLGTSVAVGAMSLVNPVDDLNSDQSILAGRSLFAVISHTVQQLPGTRPGIGRLHVSLGAGTGQFANMPRSTGADREKSKATRVFGNAALELAENWNFIGEWDGLGMNAGMSYSFPFPSFIASVTAGVADITQRVGDRPRFVFGAGAGYTLF